MEKDILKEAIADAEKIRSTAFQSAKLALEEAFQPRLKSLISAKIKEEIGDDDDEESITDGNEEEIEPSNDEEIEVSEENPDSIDIPIGGDDEEVDVTTDPETGDKTVDVTVEPEEEINLTVDGQDVPINPEETSDETNEEEFNIDELENPSVDEDVDINIDLEDDEDEQGDIDEDVDINIDTEEAPEESEEEIDIDLEPENEEDDEIEEVTKVKSELTETKNQLDNAYEVVGILRGKLNEINLLNSKLLYSNKIFRGYALNNDAKMKIVESIDRAKTVREAKLIYQTLVETIASKTEKKAKPFVKAITESIASTKIASTKPKKIINENVDVYAETMKARNKKLAGIE
jgi:hypothetical protein